MEKDIDFNGIYLSFLRNKLKIFLISILFGFGGVIYSLTQPRVWRGSFEIVMEANSSSLNESNNINSIQFADLVGQGTDLTQLEILRSPLVLTPVYNYYNKILKDRNLIKQNISYEKGFIPKLNIKKKPGSKVLIASFEDTDKQTIVDVLNKLSNIYQDYSNDNRTKKLNSSINFIQSQLEIAQINSKTSLKDLQEFNIKNNLGNFDGFILEDQGTELANKRPKRFENNFRYLADLETQLVRMRSIYKPNSKILKNMIKTKNEYEKSLKRPSEILNEYRNKFIKAQRDEKIRENLINQLYLLKFEKANNKDPWQLISNPRILENPVKPNKKRIVLLSTSSGVIIGFLMFIFFDKKSDLLFSKNDFKKTFSYPLLKTISYEKENWENNIRFLTESIKTKNKSLTILPLMSENSELFEEFSTYLKANFKNLSILKFKDILVKKEIEPIILLTTSGKITKTRLNLLLEEIKLLDLDIKGHIYLDPNLKYKDL